MKKQFAVIGLGRFGASVAKTLNELGNDVLAIDNSEEAVQNVLNNVTHAVQGDAREEETLYSLGIRNFDTVIVAIGDDIEASILITLMLKEMGIKVIVAKAMNSLHGKVLKKVGADKVVFPEKDMGIRLAHSLSASSILDYIELTNQESIIEVAVPSRFIDRSISELDLSAKYGISIIAIKRGDSVIIAPDAAEKLIKKDILILLCSIERVDKFLSE